MKSQKMLALFISITLLITSITTICFAKNNDLNLNKAVLNKSISNENLKNTVIQVNNLGITARDPIKNFNPSEEGALKFGFDVENKKLKLLSSENQYFSLPTGNNRYFHLRILDSNWKEKKSISFLGKDSPGWGKENEINNFEYNYGDILSLSSPLSQAIYIHGKILSLPEDYPYIMPGKFNSFNFEITKDGLKAINLPQNLEEKLSQNFIEIRGCRWIQSLSMKWLLASVDGFKIAFDENTKKLKVIDRSNKYYLHKYIGYKKYFQIKILDKHRKEKLNIELDGYDTGTSNKLNKLNDFKYEYGDTIKIWCESLIEQRVLGKVLEATADYSKGMKDIKDIEDLSFEITPKGLKEIRNNPPKVLGIEPLILRKGMPFNKMENVSAMDEFDGDITKNLKVTGNVNINRIGTYNLTYKISDSSNKVTEITRKITVVEIPKLEKNKISILDLNNTENFKIKFDDFKKEFEIENLKNSQINSNFNNKKYFTFHLLDKNFKEKLNLSLNGNDSATSSKLDALKKFKYEYGDIIKLEHEEPSKLKISGKILDEKEDYSDGVNNIDNLNNVYFQITNEGLKSIYNNAPVITGVKNKTIKVGDTFNVLEGVSVKDDLDSDLTVSVTGTVNTNKAGIYNLIYTTKDKLGRISTQNSTITVKELTPLEKNKLIVEGYDNKPLLNIGFDDETKKLSLLRLNTTSYFHGGFNDFFKIKIKDKSNMEKLAITIKGNDFSSTSKLNALDGFNFEYGDTMELWHASPTGVNGSLKISGYVLNSKEIYDKNLSFDAMNNTEFQITQNGLNAIYNESPIINGVNNLTINVNDSFDPLKGVYVTDDFDKNLIPEINGFVDTSTVGTYTLTYTVKDSGERKVTSSRKVTVKTNEKPILSGIDDSTIKAGTTFYNLLGVKALDKEDGDLSKNIVIKGDVNTTVPGIYKLTYSIEDSDKNIVNEIRLITVKSNNKPIFKGIDNITIKVNDYFNSLQGVIAMDTEDLDLTSQIKIKGILDTSKLGTYDLIYSVTDSDGNEAVATRRIVVRSNEKPVIHGISNKIIKARGSFNPLKDIVATDVENGDLTNKIHVEGRVDTLKEGIYTLTYSVTDDDGNITKSERNITVKSNDIPKFAHIENLTIPLGKPFDPNLGIIAIDKEDGDISHRISIKGNVNINTLGDYELIYSVDDLDGNKSIAKRLITVRSNENPTINASEIVTLKIGDSFNPKDGVEAKDFEDGDLKTSLNVDGEVKLDTLGKYTLTYYVIDSDGNKTVFKRKVVVRSNEKPILFGVKDTTLKINDSVNLLHGVTAHDAEDGDITSNIKVTGVIDSSKLGVNTISYSILDKDGNKVEQKRTIIVRSNDKPKIIGTDSVTLKIGDKFNANEGIKALDTEDGDLSSFIKISGEVDTTKEGVNTLIYSVEDKDGNTSSIKRIIKVRSNEKPKIIVDNITALKIGNAFDPLKDIVAIDVEDGDITKNIKVTGTVNTANIGEYDLLYSIEDSDGNKIDKARKVRIESNEKPTISGADNKIIKIGDSFDALEGITAADNEDKDLTNKIKIEGTVINTVKGQYSLTYIVTDSDGNTFTTERIITVKTNNTPKIFGVEDTIIKVGEKFENTSIAILALDDEDGDITNLVSTEGKVDVNIPGEYKLIYSVTDSDGNVAKAEKKITVKSNTKPVLEGIKDHTIKVGDGFNILEGVTAHDAEDLNLTDKIIVSGIVDSSKEGLYKIEYSIKDSDNNKVSKDSLVTVRSNEKPKFLNIRKKFLKIGDSFNPLNVGIIVLDKEDGDLTNKIKVEGNVDTTKIGEYHLIYSVEDSDGNITKATKKVWVRSNTPPILEGVYKTIIKIGEPFLPLENVFAKDTEDGDLTSNIQIEGNVDILNAGFYKLTYHVHDSDGNSVSKTRDVIVKSNTSPKIIGADNISIKAYRNFHKELAIEAIDIEDGNLTDQIIIEGEVNINLPGKYPLLYKVKDSDDNETIIERVVTIESNETPIIHSASDTIIKIKDNFNPLEGIIATDKEDGDLTSNIEVEGIVDINKEGNYTLVYKVSDKDNNISKITRNIKIRSNDSPIILGLDELSFNQYERFNAMIGVTAIDKEDGNLTEFIKINEEIDTSIPGQYQLTYSVKDKDGNETIIPRKIIIISNEKPLIKETEKLILKQGEDFTPLYGITAIDKEDGDISNLLKITGKLDTNIPGVYNVNYSISDSNGNTESFIRDILIKSNEKPIILYNNNLVLNLGDSFNILDGILAIDKEDGDLTKNITIRGKVDTSKVGNYDLIYSITDSDKNESIATRRITIKAINNVEILGIENIELSYGTVFNPMEGIKAIDFQGKDLTSLIKIDGLVDTNKPGVYDLNYKVKDEFGSELNFFRQIIVKPKEESEEISNKNTPILNSLIKENIEKIYTESKKIFNKYPNKFIEKTPNVMPNLIQENINKDNIDNIIEPKKTSKEKVILKKVTIKTLPPYDKKPFPFWLLGLLLIILGKKIRKKEDN